MRKIHKFYQTEGRSIIYAKFHKELEKVVENWDNTNEIRVTNDIMYITDRAFHFVIEFMQMGDIWHEVIKVSKENEGRMRFILGQIRANAEIVEFEVEELDQVGRNRYSVKAYEQIEIIGEDTGFYLLVNAKCYGVEVVDNGDYWTPPSSDITWNDEIEFDELEVYMNEDDTERVRFNEIQEEAIYKLLKNCIILP